MKKLFWCGVGIAVAAASCVYLASRHVEHSPFNLPAQALLSLGGEEEAANGAGDESVVIPPLPEPTSFDPLAFNAGPMEVVAVDQGQPGHIIIEEPTTTVPSDFAVTTGSVPQSDLPAMPAVMPYCRDDVVHGETRMPYADEGDAGEEESEPVGDVWTLLRRVAAEANAAAYPEQIPVMPREVNEEETPNEETTEGPCPEDVDYHKHHPTCPYTGRSYPLPMISPPAPEATPENNTNNSKPKYHESKKPVSKDVEEEEQNWSHHKLDTMEFRPSDAGFESFVPGPF